MSRDPGPTTLADVRVGTSAVLAPGPALDARQARRLVELGLRPGATVRVMMRTAGGGRVLGVDNLRIVVDRQTLGAIPVSAPARAAASAEQLPVPRDVTVVPQDGPSQPDSPSQPDGRPRRDGRPQPPAAPQPVGTPRPAGPAGPAASAPRHQERRRRLRLLGRSPGLTVLPGDPVGDGAD